MPRGRPRKIVIEEVSPEEIEIPVIIKPEETKSPTEKEKLQTLYQQLKDLKVNSIGDLEVMISRAE